jgi:hypothetical protein
VVVVEEESVVGKICYLTLVICGVILLPIMKTEQFQEIVDKVKAEFPKADVVKIRGLAISKAADSDDFNTDDLRSLPDYQKALDQMGYPLPN